jgi:hypothetical protein
MTASVLIYLLLLPLSVWLLGSILGLLDHDDRTAALVRIAWRTLPLLGLAIFMGSSAAPPIIAAMTTILVLHTAWSIGTRLILKRGWLSEPSEE